MLSPYGGTLIEKCQIFEFCDFGMVGLGMQRQEEWCVQKWVVVAFWVNKGQRDGANRQDIDQKRNNIWLLRVEMVLHRHVHIVRWVEPWDGMGC